MERKREVACATQAQAPAWPAEPPAPPLMIDSFMVDSLKPGTAFRRLPQWPTMRMERVRDCRLPVCLVAFLCSATAMAQEPQSPPTFESKVNLVLVPVVARDAHGRAVGNLTKDDFQLFDKGKQQVIDSFSTVKRVGDAPEEKAAASAAESEGVGVVARSSSPQRYVIYLFDDLDTEFADMDPVRAAAGRHIERGLAPTDRAAIYTVSGHPTLEFTGDRAKLEDTIQKLRVQLTVSHGGSRCPPVNYYIADLIQNRVEAGLNGDEPDALHALIGETMACWPTTDYEQAKTLARAAVRREVFLGAQDTQTVLSALRRAIRRLAEMPGQRSLILASPGFVVRTPEAISVMAGLLDQAAKANVIIGAVEPRGVSAYYADATRRDAPSNLWLRYLRSTDEANDDVLADLSAGTGGTFFHNNNDLTAGFDRVAAAPEFSYVLGFSPAELKEDGSFHSLSVRLPDQKGVSIEARRGYYAVKYDSEEETAKSDIHDAVFSREERNEIPVTVETRYSKADADNRKLTVTAKVDVRSLHFRKTDGRNWDSLTLVSALFDRDGAYVTGTTKTVNLRLLDETLAHMDAGEVVPFDFDMKPGAYVLRLVVREAEGGAISTRSIPVKIH